MVTFPMYTLWVQALIHYQAFRLWWKKVSAVDSTCHNTEGKVDIIDETGKMSTSRDANVTRSCNDPQYRCGALRSDLSAKDQRNNIDTDSLSDSPIYLPQCAHNTDIL